MSKYKNEFGTLNSDRLIAIHKFLDEQKEKGIYELSEHISDFAEQECEDYKTSLAVASRLINKLQTTTGDDRDCEELKKENEYHKGLYEQSLLDINNLEEHNAELQSQCTEKDQIIERLTKNMKEGYEFSSKQIEELKADNEKLIMLTRKLMVGGS